MKKTLKLLVLFISVFLNINIIKAECDNETKVLLNTAAANVKMDYVLETLVIDREGNIYPDINPSDIEISEASVYTTRDKVTLKVNNLNDNIWVVLNSDANDINQEYRYLNTENGSITYEVPDTDIIRHYTLTIYSNISECENEELSKIEVATPKYNNLFNNGLCQNNNANYCKKYVTSEVSISEDELNHLVENYQNDNKITNDKKEESKNPNNLILMGIALALIIMIIIVIIKKVKKKGFIEYQ